MLANHMTQTPQRFHGHVGNCRTLYTQVLSRQEKMSAPQGPPPPPLACSTLTQTNGFVQRCTPVVHISFRPLGSRGGFQKSANKNLTVATAQSMAAIENHRKHTLGECVPMRHRHKTCVCVWGGGYLVQSRVLTPAAKPSNLFHRHCTIVNQAQQKLVQGMTVRGQGDSRSTRHGL